MTVSSTQNRAAFNCDGVTTQFDFNFPYQRDADIRVLVRSPTGVETTLANLSDYSIANAGTGGRITVANPRSTGWRIVILRAPEPVQETDLLENGTYSAETLERAYDYRAMVEQRLTDLLARALILAETDTQGAGTYLAGGNRITALGDAVAGTDAVTLAQVQGLVAAGGGGSISQSVIGQLLYPQTNEEVSASVTPANFAYPAGDVRRYGTNAVPGTTDMTVAFQNAALSSLNPYAPRELVKVTGSIPLRAGQCWRLDGTEFQITGNTQVFTVAAGINDWAIRGDWTVTGDNGAAGATAGTGAALVIIDSMRFWVDGPNAKNIKGWGVLVQPGASSSNRTEKGTIFGLRASACYIGAETQPYNGGEYVNFISPMITRCATGLKATAGNTNVTGGSISDNTLGVYLLNGANGQHGIFAGVNINHNATYNVQADGVTNGHSFVGCHLYQGDIYLKNAVGVMFDACFVDPANYYFEGSNGCGFRNCTMPKGYANTLNNNYNATPSYTVWDNCRELNGALFPVVTTAMYKGLRVKATSPGIAYTPANLTAEQTVLLTDYENFTAEAAQTLYDGYNAATGTFTCRGLGDGKVRVNASFNLTNNAADDAFATGMGFVYMYLRKNGSFYRWLGRVRLTTTKTHFFIDTIIEMAKNDTLDFRIGQTGGAVANDVTLAAAETEAIVEGL
jgi:hypothetical protein